MKNAFSILVSLVLTLSLLGVGFFAQPASASYSPPTFPACPGPYGSTLASYPQGTFAIVGNPNLQTGSDYVYSLSDGNVLQCYCPSVGSVGVQTDWLQADTLNESDKSDLISQGWQLIQDGSGWGLKSVPYLALNLGSSCQAPVTTSSNSGSGSNTCTAQMPNTPVLLSASKASDQSVRLTWSGVASVSDFTIVYGLSSGNYQFGVPSTGNTTSFTVSDLDPNSSYCFALRALNSCQPSGLSNEICTTTTAEVSGQTGQGEVLGASTLAFTSSPSTTLAYCLLSLIALSLTGYGYYLKKN